MVQLLRHVALDQHADHAERVAPQREGSLSPVGLSPNRTRPTSVSSLSASATTSPTSFARQRVAGEARFVVSSIANATASLSPSAVRSSRPSRPATRGTRAMSVTRSASPVCGRSPARPALRRRVARRWPGDGANARDTLALRAELAVIDHLVEQRQARFERLLASWSKKNLASPGVPHDALVALHDGRGVFGRMLLTTMTSRSAPALSSSESTFVGFIVRSGLGGTARTRARSASSTFGARPGR